MIIAKLLDMQQKDLQLNIHDGVLNLKCERITATKNEYHHPSERRVWRFSRFFSLPENVDQAAIKAHFKKKVLTIRLPKSKNPAQMNRAIKVN